VAELYERFNPRRYRIDIRQAPMLRIWIAQDTAGPQWILMMLLHHLVDDNTGIRVMEEEIQAHLLGQADQLPPALPYRNLVAHALLGTSREEHEAFFQQMLADVDEPTAPFGLLNVQGDGAEIGESRIEVDALVARGVRERARKLGVSAASIFHLAWALVLSKVSGRQDVVFGTVLFGRMQGGAGSDRAMGLFINTLPVRIHIGEEGAEASVRRMHMLLADLLRHEHASLALAQRCSGVPAPLPLFSALLNYRHPGTYVRSEEGTRAWEGIRDLRREVRTNYPFVLSVNDWQDRFEILTLVDRSIEAGRVCRYVHKAVESLLEALDNTPDAAVCRFEILSPEERYQLLKEWNKSKSFPRPEKCIHELFGEQVLKTPDAVAVVWGTEVVSYEELNRRANRLAHYLVGLGVGPENRVGMMMERGLELIVSLLAILKAGGAYVPLDPTYPEERLNFILANSGVTVLLHQRSTCESPHCHSGVTIVDVDRLQLQIPIEGDCTSPQTNVTSGNLVYLIYTSGSTGKPKCVGVEHRQLASYVEWAARTFPARSSAVHSSICFDLAITSLFVPLLSGGYIDVISQEHGPEGLVQRLEKGEHYGFLKLTPTHLQAMEELLQDRPEACAAECFVVGGEALRGEQLEFWKRRHPKATLVNHYGPTEATVGCCTYMSRLDEVNAGRVQIGRPVPRTTLYVLDAYAVPIPHGAPGELYIGGAQVARGYLGQPGLTAERFVPDPFTGEPGARMYRTGDRMRWRAEGTLDFLGRLDEQVKIRGFRIEPGEVESVLGSAAGVREVRVILREDAPGEKRLVAYVVGEAEVEQLRLHLQRSLPDYMVPAAFVRLERLPLTANGKLDRKALPVPEVAAGEATYIAPRTPTEEVLAKIWAEVLGVERIGANDNFFELGGDSIIAIQVVSRARRAGLNFGTRHVFQYQTIGELASAASEGQKTRPEVSKTTEGKETLTPIQARFFEQNHPAVSHYNQAVLLAVAPTVTDAVLERALAFVSQQHEALRLRFRRTSAGWEQFHAPQSGLALERVDLSRVRSEERDHAQEEVAGRRQASLDLQHGPVARAILFDRGNEGRLLLLVIHHLVVDGVSWRILRDELECVCAQAENGNPMELQPEGTSYTAWAQALNAYAASKAIASEVQYWTRQGECDVPSLPLATEGQPAMSEQTTVITRLDEQETRSLMKDVPAAGAQINEVLVCALVDALQDWTANSRVRLALEHHGRMQEICDTVDLTHTVGWLTSIYPLAIESKSAGSGERLKSVTEQLRAVPNHGIGYGILRYLAPDAAVRRALTSQDEPEVLFNYLGMFDDLSGSVRFRFATGPRAAELAPSNRRPYRLVISGGIQGGVLQLYWHSGDGTCPGTTLDRLANTFLQKLRSLLLHCRGTGGAGYTLSDFPLASITQSELISVLSGRRGTEDLYPLSPLQEGLLFHAIASGENQAYQVQVAHRLEGALDPVLFQRAWVEVARRHSNLRTSFLWEGLRRPLQRVQSAVELPWVVEDWSTLPQPAQDSALNGFLDRERAKGFRLEEAPLFRCALLRVAGDVHWFVLSRHHLITDGSSSVLIMNEVFRLYDAWSAGKSIELKPVRPYRDYIAWLQRQDLASAEQYWRQMLAGFRAPTSLPRDRTGSSGVNYAKCDTLLSTAQTAHIKAATRDVKVTVNTILQGAWALLLSRYSSEEDVVFGYTVATRPVELEGVEEMTGVFLNTVPLRTVVSDNARLAAWLRDLQLRQAQAREFDYAPLMLIQEWSEVPRGAPLFESHFLFDKHPVEHVNNSPLRETERRGVDWTNYPLSLMSAVVGDRLLLQLSYDQDQFEEETIQRMLGHLERILVQVAANPDMRLSDVDIMRPEERHRVLHQWNKTNREFPGDRCCSELFEAQVMRTPEAIAVVHGHRELSYRELNVQANRLAHHLKDLNVKPNARVAVCLDRGIEAVVGLLAILKAGGTYVPLDPSYPVERLRFMLEDCEPTVVLTQGQLTERWAGRGKKYPTVDLAAQQASWSTFSESNLDRAELNLDTGQLAYIIYTSGSTGQPKGAMIRHNGMINHIHGMLEKLPPHSATAFLQNAPLSFDVSVWQIIAPLLEGGRTVIADPDTVVDAEKLHALLKEKGITLMELVPSLLKELLRHSATLTPEERALPALKAVIAMGEVLPTAMVELWFALYPGLPLANAYGPTEASDDISMAVLHEPLPPGTARVPIGRPLHNLATYVLDRNLQLVPIGVPGEICVSGVGVGAGYWRNETRTKSAFVANPYAGEDRGNVLYRTGDLGRYRADGNIEFLGRNDFQVKVRGFRIELGEIEARLLEQTGVREAVVIAREDAPGEKRLVAYMVGDFDAGQLRTHLKQTLPDYMVPAAFVNLERLPFTPNGKLDRKALPVPDMAGDDSGYIAPRTPVEEVLAKIWAQVLGVGRVGVNDNFFELGGHSLATMQVSFYIREIFGIKLSLRVFFDLSTIAELASLLSSDARYADTVKRIGSLVLQARKSPELGKLSLS
jgi:amino acid adenylation domain-containing protein/non-ribosomal peptide synthase protein (TIGR01720 family)